MECEYSKFSIKKHLIISPVQTNAVIKGLLRGLLFGLVFSSIIAYIGVIDFGKNEDEEPMCV